MEKRESLVQKEMDFNWSTWFRALENLKLPPRAERLLRAIQTFRGNNRVAWPSIATLSAAAGFSTNTTRRWLRWLEDEGFVTVIPRTRDNGSHSSHEIAIIDSAVLASRAPATTPATTPTRPAPRPRPRLAARTSPPGGTSNLGGGTARTEGGYLKTGSPKNHLPAKSPPSNCQNQSGAGSQTDEDGRGPPGRRRGKAVPIIWGRDLFAHDLRDPDTLFELYGIAVAQGKRANHEFDLLQFIRVALWAADEGDEPGRLFSWAVTEEEYNRGRIEHDERARQIIRTHVHETEPARVVYEA